MQLTNIGQMQPNSAALICDPLTGTAWALPLPVIEAGGTQGMQYGCKYTPISTSGTTIINTGGGLYFGLASIALGVTWGAAVYDVYVDTATHTGTLAASITVAALGIVQLGGPTGVGVRYNGTLEVVTIGITPGIINALWD